MADNKVSFIDRYTIKSAIDTCLDIASFGGVGYLSGHLVNALSSYSSKSSFFNELEKTNVQSTAVCCALFIAIDRPVQGMLRILFQSPKVDQPVYSAVRMGINGFAAIELFNLLAPRIEHSSVKMKPAAAVVITALLIYSNLVAYIHYYNSRQ